MSDTDVHQLCNIAVYYYISLLSPMSKRISIGFYKLKINNKEFKYLFVIDSY